VRDAFADALAPFGEVAVDLPLTPAKLLTMIEGRPWPERPVSRFHPYHRVPEVEAPAPVKPSSPPVAPAIPVGIEGAWKLVLATPMGPQPMVAHFQVAGDRVTGRLEVDQGSQDFAGTVSGDQVAWEMKVTKPMAITLKYALVFAGDVVSGKCKMGLFGTAKERGERSRWFRDTKKPPRLIRDGCLCV